MSYQSCPDCGERVYKLGCTNCNETAYIAEQEALNAMMGGREYCQRCGSGPRQAADVDECPDCGRQWGGPPLIGKSGEAPR
jgi:hypothetical protein